MVENIQIILGFRDLYTLVNLLISVIFFFYWISNLHLGNYDLILLDPKSDGFYTVILDFEFLELQFGFTELLFLAAVAHINKNLKIKIIKI